MASTSGVDTMGVAGAQAARIKVVIIVKMLNLAFIVPLLINDEYFGPFISD